MSRCLTDALKEELVRSSVPLLALPVSVDMAQPGLILAFSTLVSCAPLLERLCPGSGIALIHTDGTQIFTSLESNFANGTYATAVPWGIHVSWVGSNGSWIPNFINGTV